MQEKSVHIIALWVCGRTIHDMVAGDPISRRWIREHEANPNLISSSSQGEVLEINPLRRKRKTISDHQNE